MRQLVSRAGGWRLALVTMMLSTVLVGCAARPLPLLPAFTSCERNCQSFFARCAGDSCTEGKSSCHLGCAGTLGQQVGEGEAPAERSFTGGEIAMIACGATAVVGAIIGAVVIWVAISSISLGGGF